MKRLLPGLIGVLVLLVLVCSFRAQGQAEKVPDIKEIMAKLNKPTGIYFSLMRELKEEEPMWDEARQQSKTLTQLSAVLGKHTPPRGDRASWQALTKAYADNARATEQAVLRMDKAAALAALEKIS